MLRSVYITRAISGVGKTTFAEYIEQIFVFEQEEKFDLPENSCKIYALWAANWK